VSKEFTPEQIESDFCEIVDCARVIITLCNEAICDETRDVDRVAALVEGARDNAQRIGWIGDRHQTSEIRGGAEEWMLRHK